MQNVTSIDEFWAAMGGAVKCTCCPIEKKCKETPLTEEEENQDRRVVCANFLRKSYEELEK